MASPPLDRAPVPPGVTTLQRFTVRPGHLDAWLGVWPREVAARRRHGFVLHRAFVETDAEPKVTALWSHPDHVRGAPPWRPTRTRWRSAGQRRRTSSATWWSGRCASSC
ncbi:hypothetical protein G7070_10050 [Propioniciclava coleopterorum]|uniref:NIPSNAP protein n=1 Tax=Propioniciclava coleopterorum TaxID=2714937 RepID=A0A6G7Y6Y3_9ACTN|nr:hypothetical protein [Propioniciclava coleopterorum]QIK72550.1 hypothetical protein G7070_10050 [Propioniciclava coleopterorum]